MSIIILLLPTDRLTFTRERERERGMEASYGDGPINKGNKQYFHMQFK